MTIPAYVVHIVLAVLIVPQLIRVAKHMYVTFKVGLPFVKRTMKTYFDPNLSIEEKQAAGNAALQELEFGEHNYNGELSRSLVNGRRLYSSRGESIPRAPLSEEQLRGSMTGEYRAEFDRQVREYRLEIYELEKRYNSTSDKNLKELLLREKLQKLDMLENFIDSHSPMN